MRWTREAGPVSLGTALPRPDPFLPSEVERVGVELVNQFVLSRSAPASPEGWVVHPRGGWVLSCHPRLPVIDLYSPEGEAFGWILGHPIDERGEVVKASYVIPVSVEAWRSDPHSALTRCVRGLAGCYVLISLPPPISRVYLDPFGSLPAVFCPVQQVVASSVTLVPFSDETRFDEPLTTAIGVIERDGWFPLGLTCRHGVERLIPNHYLELSGWQVCRYWPDHGDLGLDVEPDLAIQQIGDRVTRNVQAVAREYPIYLGLTAGRDTRMLLACSRDVLDRIELISINLPDRQGRLDCHIASRLAQRLNLRHRVIAWQEASERDKVEWLYRTGFSVAGRAMRSMSMLRQLDSGRCVLSGFGGEVGRVGGPLAFKEGPERVTPDFLTDYVLKRTQRGDIPEVMRRARRWVEQIASLPPSVVIALYWLEQRLGCWAGPQQYGFVRPPFQLYPFSDPQVIQRFLSLPLRYRDRETMARKLIAARWPELLQLPFNKPLGFQRCVWEVQRGLKRIAGKSRALREKGLRP